MSSKLKLSFGSTAVFTFQRAFTAYSFDFKEVALVGSNQGNYFENAVNGR